MSNTPAAYPRVIDDSLCFRAARNESWVDKRLGSPKRAAFLLRRERHETGLSVALGTISSCAGASAVLSTCSAVWWLIVREIRNLPTTYRAPADVVQDEPDHGAIIGVPYIEDDSELAEAVAKELMSISHRGWPPGAPGYDPEPELHPNTSEPSI